MKKTTPAAPAGKQPTANHKRRIRPADEYFKLRRRAGTALARERADHDNAAVMAELRETDCQLMPVLLQALRQCAGGGKLHPEIADHLADMIEAGLEGKLPMSWPEPIGGRVTWRNRAEPEDIAVLYLAAGRKGLLKEKAYVKTLTRLFGVTEKNIEYWQKYRAADITTASNGYISAFCYGQTIGAPSAETFAQALEGDPVFPKELPHAKGVLRKAADEYRARRGLPPLEP